MKTIKFVAMSLFMGFCAANTAMAQIYTPNYNTFNEEGIRIGDQEFNDVIGHQIGPVELKATASTEEDYDSNIFWTPTDKKGDSINVSSPGILLNLPLGIDQRHLLQFMYNADIGTFSRYSSQNYVNQYAAFNGDFKLPFGYVDLQNNYDHTSDRATTEFTGEVWRTDNDASATVGVEFNKLALETAYHNILQTYDESNLYGIYDYTQNVVSETAYYQFMPKTKALIEYDHDFITYTKDSDRSGNYDQIRVGLKGDIFDKTQAIVKLGYQNRNYNNSEGFEGFVAEVGTITELTERTKLSLTYDQGAQESVYLNNNYYDQHYFYATLEQKLKGHFTLEVNSGISRNIYPEIDPDPVQKRQDSILIEGVALKYNIKEWASIKVGYTFREDITNVYSESYQDNLYSVKFEAQF
jgi:hypothetical protein